MESYRTKNLRLAITQLENSYPDDNLIVTYKDFIKVRDHLHEYRFNPVVFTRILGLAIELWPSPEKINRISFFRVIKKYYLVNWKNNPKQRFSISRPVSFPSLPETRQLLFELMRKVFEEAHFMNPNQIDEARKICNNVLINVALTPREEKWFVERAFESENFLNRVLRYPVQSKIITDWVRSNYFNDNLRDRRAELAAWLLDENPDYEIDQKLLIEDFEVLNRRDMQAIKNYEDELAAIRTIENELGDILPKKRFRPIPRSEDSFYDTAPIALPELKLANRFYNIPVKYGENENYPVSIPDFDEIGEKFLKILDDHQQKTMIWAIAYSHLPDKTKTAMLSKYYKDENFSSIYFCGLRTQNVDLLKWLLEKELQPRKKDS